MKAAFVNGRGGVEVRDVPTPVPGPGELLVKMRNCGVCGTDLEKVRGHGATNTVLGHEAAGEVAGLGKGVTDYPVGSPVFVHHHVSCGVCYFCLNDSPTMCPLFLQTNLEPCGFADYFKVPAANVGRGAVLRLPSGLTAEEGSFIEPLACCLRSLDRIGFTAGMSTAIIGFGPMGALYLMLLRSLGASFVAVGDVADFRLSFAERLGADVAVNLRRGSLSENCMAMTDRRGVDVAVVATGNLAAYGEALRTVRRGGRVCIFGAPSKASELKLDLTEIFFREISFIPSYSTTERETNRALKLLTSKTVKPSLLVTHRFRLDDVAEAFRVAADPERSMKVVVSET